MPRRWTARVWRYSHLLASGLALTLALLAPPRPAGAEPPPGDVGDDEVVVDVIEDAPDARAVSAWRATLSTDRLRLRGEELSAGLLALPGTWVRRSGAEGAFSSLSVRGAGANQVLVMFDGIPLNAARGGAFDLSMIPPALLDRLELYRGGSGARFGSGAIGGAVNAVPRRPDEGSFLTVSGGYGSFGTVRLGGGGAGRLGDGPVRWLAGADYFETDGDFTFVDGQGVAHTRVNASARRLGTVAAVEAGGGGLRLGLTSLVTAIGRGSPGPSEFQEAVDEARQTELNAITAATAEKLDLLSWPGAVVDGTLRLAHRYGLSGYENPDRLLASAAPFETTATEHTVEAFGQLSLFNRAGQAAHLSLDADVATLERTELVAVGERREEDFSRGTFGAAAFVDLGADDRRLSVMPAVRAEAVTVAGPALSPSIGARAEVVDGLEVLANLARAWRAPSLDELYLETELIEGDPDLSPEDALSADAGLRLTLPWLVAEAVAFRLDIDDLILFLPVSPTLYRAQNTGPASAHGAELTAHLRPTRWLAASGGYTFTRARFGLPPFDPLPGRPAHKATGEVRARLLGLEAFGRALYRSAVFLDNFGNLRNPPATILDAGATLEVLPGLHVTATGRNLTDVQTVVDALQMPQPGRSFHVQIVYSEDVVPDEERAP